jgi:UDP-glucose 4-epimerase
MKVLVFGHTGFLGSKLYQFLSASGYTVTGASRNKKFDSDIFVDVTNAQTFENIESVPDLIINCAACLPSALLFNEEYSRRCFEVNAIGALNIGNYAVKNAVPRLIHCSTLSVIAKPWPIDLSESVTTMPIGNQAVYGASKLSGELLLQSICKDSTSLAILRFSALYGPSMPWVGVICNFIDQAKKGQRIQLFNGGSVYADFLFIDDAVDCIVRISTSKETGIFNIASGEETSLITLAQAIKKVANEKAEISNQITLDAGITRAKISIQKFLKTSPNKKFVELQKGIQLLYQSLYD